MPLAGPIGGVRVPSIPVSPPPHHQHVTLTPNRVESAAVNCAALSDFPATAPAANPVFYRTYSRRSPAGRESWSEVGQRNLEGLRQLGNLNNDEVALLARMQAEKKALPSGRWLWIGGTR